MFKNSQDKKIALAMILANYAKRNLEGVYDNFSNSEFGKKLKRMKKENKYALEFFLYLISTTVDQKLDEQSFWSKFFKEITTDAMPEISKRFLNGKEELNLEQIIPELEKSFLFVPEEKEALHQLLPKKSFSEKVESCLDAIIRNLKK